MSSPAHTTGPARTVHVIMPGDVDDASVPSGGNIYDRRVCQGLATAGWRVQEAAISGEWPQPAEPARTALARSLTALPDGAAVLLDGLVACAVPELVEPHADRLRLVVLVHLPLADETGTPPAVAAALAAREQATLRAATAVVATSPWAAGRLSSQHRLDADRIHVAPPGVDPAPVTAGSRDGTALLCVAALTPRKGQDLLVEALAQLTDRSWHCACVGPRQRAPQFVAQLRASITRHQLDDRVQLAGPQRGPQLAATYAAADLLVLPSRAETYGMVVTEALARGIPVLASAVDGVPETLGQAPDGSVPGLLVPPEDPAALAGALRRWLTEADLRDQLRESALRRRAGLAGWDETVRKLAAVLNQWQPQPQGAP